MNFTDDTRDDATKALHAKLDALEKPVIEAMTRAWREARSAPGGDFADVEYGPAKELPKEYRGTYNFRRIYRVVAGCPITARQGLELYGYHTQPKVIHPNGSGGTEAYVLCRGRLKPPGHFIRNK